MAEELKIKKEEEIKVTETPLAPARDDSQKSPVDIGSGPKIKEDASAKGALFRENRPIRRKNFRKNTRRPGRKPRIKSEFDQKIVSIRRVTRVVAGGRRFSFSVAVVIGNRKGKVGVGIGKATDTALAIEKAVRDARKNLVTLKLDDRMSVPYEIKAKFNASIVEMRPAPGRGIVVGSSVRDVIELAGIKDVSAKLLSRSKNKLNNARAAIKALSQLD